MSTTPSCRVCGDTDAVLCYWPEKPELAICPDCCEHDDGYEYDRDERSHRCPHCCGEPPADWYDDYE